MIKPTGIVPPTKGQCEQYVCLDCGHRFSKRVGSFSPFNVVTKALFPIRCPKCKSTKCISLPDEWKT
ncbi:hypothetical protein [Treponema phagedenis]|uniref:hypothetical protein n=1 Tax=Treponema phagedenis TaxID=162 RepID=UPI0011EC9465|nr:hypothetical protein [Treponema phagedenis]TYT78409.1 hypothetical protein FS559_04390 [Treponema phagedenis]